MIRRLVALLGIPIDTFNMQETIDQIVEFVHNGHSTGKGYQIATANTDFIVKAIQDPELSSILQTTDLITADGMPLVWAAKLLGAQIEERVAGSDFVPILAERAEQEGFSLYLLGAAPGVAAKAADVLMESFPDLKIVGIKSPPFMPVAEMDDSIVDQINSADPDILLVAFGNPKQEMWISLNKHKLRVPVMIGIGGTLDFISGTMKRAPQWMHPLGLEWLFRLLQEPRRLWKRYGIDIVVFSTNFLRQWWVLRKKGSGQLAPLSLELDRSNGYSHIAISNHLDVRSYPELWEMGQAALAHSSNVTVDLDGCDYLDSSGFGALMGLAKQAADAGGELRLKGLSKELEKAIAVLRLKEFFHFEC
jgi:N-acetylglucosaminyldiphosphoundecaprenol N-acetyl-beta-D-mannosaminyltransferase